MTLYEIIYDFFATYFFTDQTIGGMEFTIGGSTINGNEWLIHTFTIAVLVLFAIVLIIFVKAVFKWVGGAILGMGK